MTQGPNGGSAFFAILLAFASWLFCFGIIPTETLGNTLYLALWAGCFFFSLVFGLVGRRHSVGKLAILSAVIQVPVAYMLHFSAAG